jgi:DNA-binding CsgD family transcriptional regulator
VVERLTSDDVAAALAEGRAAVERRAWREAHDALSRADGVAPLAAADLELLAVAAYLLGEDDAYVAALERAHRSHLDEGATRPAVRCAFWIGMTLALRGEVGTAGGWLGRAQSLLGEEDVPEQAYLLMPLVFRHEAAGDFESAAAVAAEARAIAARFGDTEALALTTQAHGYMLLHAGRVGEGLALLDEAMVVVAGGGLSPISTGMVYCAVILACQDVLEVRRAREWTGMLARWCGEQPDLVAFTGRCLVHRAEILQLQGAWDDALAEARRASARLAHSLNRGAAAQAAYRRGELHRLRGELDEAEAAYREASGFGWEPQPGLALLRVAQGRGDVALKALRRALDETSDPLRRATLLPALVEVALDADEVDEARAACHELASTVERYRSEMLDALVAQTRGAVALASGDARTALVDLRRAGAIWTELGAPYDAARVRVLVARACRALGDEDGASLELDAARRSFTGLGAAPDLARLDAAGAGSPSHGLTARQLEVLRLVARGRTNREIATELTLSEHTVARHLQNIYASLGVSSRTAASAYAFEHRLV